jgi:hypothetical protein
MEYTFPCGRSTPEQLLGQSGVGHPNGIALYSMAGPSDTLLDPLDPPEIWPWLGRFLGPRHEARDDQEISTKLFLFHCFAGSKPFDAQNAELCRLGVVGL